MSAALIAKQARERNRQEKARERRKSIEEESLKKELELQGRADTTFDQFDANKDGVLDHTELKEFMKSLTEAKAAPPDTSLETIMMHVAGDREGSIPKSSMSKLLVVADAFVLKSERVAELFPEFDKDSNGTLTYDELVPMLRVLLKEVAPSARMSSGDVLYLIGKCDLDGDNALSQDELLPAVVLWAQMAKLLPTDDDEEAEPDELMIEVVRVALEEAEAGGGAEEDHMAKLRAEKKAKKEASLAARCHPLEGAKILKKGMDKSNVRTMSGSKLVIDNKELAECARAIKAREKEKSKSDLKAATPAASEKKSSACVLL